MDDYDETCRRAGALLREEDVASWVGRAYPVLLVDEIQDSKGGQLDLLQAVAQVNRIKCLLAGDHYQDLDGDEDNLALTWARDAADVVTLEQIHRTAVTGLLEAAAALREKRNIPTKGPGFTVLGALNHNVAASFVAKNITWWAPCNDLVLLSPVRPESSRFVRGVIERLAEKPIGKKSFGPYRVPWETTQKEGESSFLEWFNIPSTPTAEVSASDLALGSERAGSQALAAWIDRQRRVAGRTAFSAEELRQQIRRIHQRSRAFSPTREHGIRATTIHQAKNREFHSVIVLWPYEVQKSAERLRRLLYNALTRATHRALVVVQNPKRLKEPPFVNT